MEDDGALDLGIEVAPSMPNPVQVLVGAYVDAITSSGGIATTSQREAIGKNVRRLIEIDQIPLPVLLVAVQRAGARRQRTVDPFLGDAQAGFSSSQAARQAMFTAWDQLPARLAAIRSVS